MGNCVKNPTYLRRGRMSQTSIRVEHVDNGYLIVDPWGKTKVYVTIEQLLVAVKDWMQ